MTVLVAAQLWDLAHSWGLMLSDCTVHTAAVHGHAVTLYGSTVLGRLMLH
jgi:hypothetical protein